MSQTYNIEIEKGATWKLVVESVSEPDSETPMDLTGYVARAQVLGPNRLDVLEDLIGTEADPDPEDEIVFDDNDGATVYPSRMTLVLDADRTAALDFSTGLWSLELESPGGEVIRALEGTATLSPRNYQPSE